METTRAEIPGHQPVKRKVGFYLSVDVADALSAFCERNRVVRSEFADAAIGAALKRHARLAPRAGK